MQVVNFESVIKIMTFQKLKKIPVEFCDDQEIMHHSLCGKRRGVENKKGFGAKLQIFRGELTLSRGRATVQGGLVHFSTYK